MGKLENFLKKGEANINSFSSTFKENLDSIQVSQNHNDFMYVEKDEEKLFEFGRSFQNFLFPLTKSTVRVPW